MYPNSDKCSMTLSVKQRYEQSVKQQKSKTTKSQGELEMKTTKLLGVKENPADPGVIFFMVLHLID